MKLKKVTKEEKAGRGRWYDDACGTASTITYTATTAGTYQIRAGCYSSNSCSGTVAWTLQ